MDWRSFIPHALVGGALFGGILAAVLIPALRRREIRRRRKAMKSATKKIESAQPLSGPGEPYVKHRKWPSLRCPWKGYYGSG